MTTTDTLTLLQQLKQGINRDQIIRTLQARYSDPIARDGLRRAGVRPIPLGLNVGQGRFPTGYLPKTTIAEIFYANP